MEKAFTRSGIVIVDAIEAELLGQIIIVVDENNEHDSDRLRTLAAFSTAFSGLWDTMTYLRQQYSLSCSSSSATNEASKNSSRPPNKIDGFNGQAFWQKNTMRMRMDSLDSEQTMLNTCRAFIELFYKDGVGELAIKILNMVLKGALPKFVPKT
ncbi:Sister chromatid cohesion protein 2 [Clarireedia jacksonii]